MTDATEAILLFAHFIELKLTTPIISIIITERRSVVFAELPGSV